MVLPYNYFVAFLQGNKVKEQHYCQSIDEVRTLQAVARSLHCTFNYFQLNPDAEKFYEKVEAQEPDKKPKVKSQKRNGWCRNVLCIETNTVFQSIYECSRATGIPYKSIYNAAISGNERNGLHFKFTNGYSKQKQLKKRR